MGSTISNSAPIAPIVSGVEPAQQSDAERTSDLQRAYREQCRAALDKRDDGRDCDDTEAQRAHARKKTKRNGEPPGAAGGMPAPHAARDRAFALRFGGARLGEARSGANARDARVGAGAEAGIEAGIEAGVGGGTDAHAAGGARTRAAKSRRAAARRCAATRRPPARFARLANAHPPLRRPTRTRRKRRPRARRRPCRCRRRTRRRARRAAARAISRPPPRGFARRRWTGRRASSRRARRRCPPRAGRPRRRPPHRPRRPCRPCRRHDARRPPLRRAPRANASTATATIRTVRATRRSPACRAAFNRRRRCAPPSPRRGAHDPSRAARQRAQAGAAQADARDVRETQGTQVRYSFNSWDGRPAVELRFDAGGARARRQRRSEPRPRAARDGARRRSAVARMDGRIRSVACG
ncbi:putative bsaU protein [Burkholderia pseudomallei MSHR520]|nr:putative bsaU protein [Burkholderia pseudomallei MSHR520]